MKTTITVVSGVVFLFLMQGCGEPRIDAGSDDKMEKSIEKVKASLAINDRKAFEDAIVLVALEDLDFQEVLSDSRSKLGTTKRKVREALNGKTAHEVLALAEKIRIQNVSDQRKREEEERTAEARLAQYRVKQQQIEKLLRAAEELVDENKFGPALSNYMAVLSLDSTSTEADKGIRAASDKIKSLKEKSEYMSKLILYDFEASQISTYTENDVPAVKFKLKNEGNRTLTRVEVTVYLKDCNGKIIKEEDFQPVWVTEYSFGDNNKPLKPGYIWQMNKGQYYTIKNAPSEWEVGNAVAKITNIEFGSAE